MGMPSPTAQAQDPGDGSEAPGGRGEGGCRSDGGSSGTCTILGEEREASFCLDRKSVV